MTDFASIINGINQVTQTVGAVNGAVNVMAPALQSMEMAVNNVAGNFMPGYGQDMYAPPPGYYYPPQPMPNSLSMSGDSPIGTIGNAIAGGVIGATQGKSLAASIKPPKGTENATVIPGSKNVMMTGLKAGGIGAAVGGLFSGIQNIMKLSKNEITGGEATGNIVADTSVGFFSGIGGLATGTMGAMMLGAMGTTPALIGAAALGLLGATGIDLLLKKSGFRQAIADGVRSMVGN